MKAIVSLSGGMDSATVLAKAVERYGSKEVSCVGFTYGSKHNQFENECARKLAENYLVPFNLIDLSNVGDLLQSNLLLSGEDIPEGHYEDDNMSKTVVPGRNMIFVSILAGVAWTRGAEEVWLGIHSGDHAIYPDCRPEFFEAMNVATAEGTGGKVGLVAPFLEGNKKTILEYGFNVGVPYHLTRTCYKHQSVACGMCGACQERLEAFRELGVEDPIDYEFRGVLPRNTT